MLSIFRNLGNGGGAAVDAEIREVADVGSVPDGIAIFLNKYGRLQWLALS